MAMQTGHTVKPLTNQIIMFGLEFKRRTLRILNMKNYAILLETGTTKLHAIKQRNCGKLSQGIFYDEM
jgi:hypothetical protein